MRVPTLDKTRCQIDTFTDCSPKEVKFIAKAKAMSAEEREAKEAARRLLPCSHPSPRGGGTGMYSKVSKF